MKDLAEYMTANLLAWGEFIEMVMHVCSLLCVSAGAIISVIASVRKRKGRTGAHPMHTYFRRTFGGWLIVALEFLLAADIVGTIIAPATSQLIQLGAVALIRTFLNYFLNKELIEASMTTNNAKESLEGLTLVQEQN